MKMRLKLIIITVLITLTCCDDSDFSNVNYLFEIANSSNYNIEIKSFDSKEKMLKNSIIVLSGTTFQFDTTISYNSIPLTEFNLFKGDSIQILFNHEKVLIYKCLGNGEGCETDQNILNSFVSKTFNKGSNISKQYLITDIDFEKSISLVTLCDKTVRLNNFDFHYKSEKLMRLTKPGRADINFNYNSEGLLTVASNGFGWAYFSSDGNLDSYVSTAGRYILTTKYYYRGNRIEKIIKFRRNLDLPPSTPADTLTLVNLEYEADLLTQEVVFHYTEAGLKYDSSKTTYEYNSVYNKLYSLKNELLPYRFDMNLNLAEVLSSKHLSRTISGFDSYTTCDYEYEQQTLSTKYYFCEKSTSIEYACK
jgi:hypothetical protein